MRVLLLLYPWLELWTLIALGSQWGVAAAMLWVMLMAALGMVLIRWVGRTSIRHLLQAQQSGALSGRRLLDEVYVAVAGLLLLVPGVISDILSLAVLFGPLRRGLLRGLGVSITTDPGRANMGSVVIDGEYHTLQPETDLLPVPPTDSESVRLGPENLR